MDFYGDVAFNRMQVDVVLRNQVLFFNFVSHLLHQGEYAFLATVHPKVYVACLAHVGVGVEPCICRSLEYGGLAPLCREKFREPCRLFVQELVVPLDGFGFACPLENQIERRPLLLGQLANCPIDDACHQLLDAHGMKLLPFPGIELPRK